MIDRNLIQQYLSAVQARDIVKQLPVGLRDHAEQFEQLCLHDIRAQCGNPDLTEQDVIAIIKPTLTVLAKQALSLAINYVISALKKHYPALALSTASGIISYLAK
jgi:hypothetical protein